MCKDLHIPGNYEPGDGNKGSLSLSLSTYPPIPADSKGERVREERLHNMDIQNQE